MSLLALTLTIIFVTSTQTKSELEVEGLQVAQLENSPKVRVEVVPKEDTTVQAQVSSEGDENGMVVSVCNELCLKIHQASEMLENGTTPEDLNARSETLSQLMVSFNARAGVRNQEYFPHLAQDHIVLVVYSHRRADYLQIVLDALRLVEGINETLLIVSHDGYFPETVAAVQTVDFCQVAEVFVPYSPQVFRHTHPGSSLGDCPSRISLAEAQALGCKGDPDQYGNYREPKFVSLKHHWFWLMNYLWDGFPPLQGFEGYLAFIEEDHVLSRNAYLNLKAVAALRPELCPEECLFLNIGPSIADGHLHQPGVVIDNPHNAGYAFDRKMWNKIRASASRFCEFDDYNWDFSLSFLLDQWHPNVSSIMPMTESIIHIGKCGMHFANDNCNPSEEVAAFFAEDHPFVDQRTPQVTRRELSRFKQGFTGWGGWGDKRDQALCMWFTKMNDGPRR